MSSLRTLGAAGCALVLCSCATPVHQSLSGDRNAIKSTDVVEVVVQSELNANIEESKITQATGGGAIFALIDGIINSSRASSAEDAVGPLRNQLLQSHFDEQLRHETENALGGVKWLGTRSPRIIKQRDQDSLDAELAKSTAGAVLFIDASYALNPDFSALTLEAKTWLAAKDRAFRASQKDAPSKESAKPEDAAYRNTLTVSLSVTDDLGSRDDNARKWSQNDAAMLKGALERGTAQLAILIAEDLRSEGGEAGSLATVNAIPGGKAQRAGDGTLTFAATISPNDVAPPAAIAAEPAPVVSAPAPTVAVTPTETPAAPNAAPAAATVVSAAATLPASALAPAPTTLIATPAPATVATAPVNSVPSMPRIAKPAPASLTLGANASLVNRPTASGTQVAFVPAGETVTVVSSMDNAAGYWLMVRSKEGSGWLHAEASTP